MKTIKKLREIALAIKLSFLLLWKGEKKVFFYMILLTGIDLINTFILILFPKYLLDGLIQRRNQLTIFTILLFGLSKLIFHIIGDIFTKRKEICLERNRFFLETLLIEKMTILRYEQVENTENLKRYEFARKCIDRGSIEEFVKEFLSIIASIITISGVIYILREIPFWILALIFFVILINTIGNIKRTRYEYQEMTEETPTERSLYYVRGRLMDQEYAKEIRAFGLNDFISDKTKQYIEGFFDINQKYNHKHNKILWWVDMIEGIQMFSLYFYNVLLLWKNEITVGSFAMNSSAIFQFSTSINHIIVQLISMVEQGVYIKDYFNFIHLESDCKGKKIVKGNKNFTLEFQNVSFRYPGQENFVLEGINVKIKTGEKISIVGINGAGKSTFIKLLLGLYQPTAGKILLDGIDIEDYEHKSYLKLFSAVMQDYQIYSFTILENIVWKTELSAEECNQIKEAITDIGLDYVIEGLENGMNTYLTQRYNQNGIELSGGEYQKLAIVRALYRNSPIMVLDEPTSALSPQSEYDIYKHFSKITSDKTVLYISHRLSSCSLCDRILVFCEGKLVEDGTHKELLENRALYADMYKKQSSLYGW